MTDLVPFQTTTTLEEEMITGSQRKRRFVAFDSAVSGRARVDFEWWATFTHPGTWTDDEAKGSLRELLAESARARCLVLLCSLPEEIVPIVLPQLEEMINYELHVLRVRKEVEGPDIQERWVSLPVGT